MKGKKSLAGLSLAAAMLLVGASGFQSAARAQEGGKQPYTLPEYNAYQSAVTEKTAQQRIKLLDDFIAKYPNSNLLPYIYQAYYRTFNELKNSARVIEYADREVSLGEKSDTGTRLEALYLRTLAYNTLNSSDKVQAAKAREAALAGLKVLGELKKPENMDEKIFEEQKKGPTILFNYTAGVAAVTTGDFRAAIDSFKSALALNPNDAVTYFRLGVAYLSMNPPQQMNGFWALARSVALKGPGEAQVRSYLRGQITRYQLPTCDGLIDPQMNELVTLASGSAERPATYKIPSAADLDAARKEMTIASVIADLKAGGDKAKITWLAACGLEFPDVPSKPIEVVPGTDAVTLKAAFVTSDEEFEAAATPDMEVKIVGQPDATRVDKDNVARFTATLVSYDPAPLMLRWDKGKVNPADIPDEKKPATKRPRRSVSKKPRI